MRALWAGPALALLLAAGAARADGAFPTELQVFLPPAFPHRIGVGTNFGLLLSEDDGQSWDFVCEQHVAGDSLVGRYALGPEGALYATVDDHLARSNDQGCTWQSSADLPGALAATDLFADPTSPHGRVAATGLGLSGGPQGKLFLSEDGAASFGPVVHSEPNALVGVEYAPSELGLLYVGFTRPATDGGRNVPVLATLEDGGWSEAVHPELAGRAPYLAQVDPEQADTVYLRLVDPTSPEDQLGVATGRGAQIDVALELGEPMSGLVRASDGTLYVGGLDGTLWSRPADGGAFTHRAGPHLRCLGERAGHLYACGDNNLDGYALGVSGDHGQAFRALLRFNDLHGPSACAAQDCAAAFRALQRTFPPDAGPVDAGSGSAPDAGPTPAPAHRGCGCAGADGALPLAGLAAWASWAARRRRR